MLAHTTATSHTQNRRSNLHQQIRQQRRSSRDPIAGVVPCDPSCVAADNLIESDQRDQSGVFNSSSATMPQRRTQIRSNKTSIGTLQRLHKSRSNQRRPRHDTQHGHAATPNPVTRSVLEDDLCCSEGVQPNGQSRWIQRHT